MARFERVEDKWKHLRKDLYGNVEPEVTLEAITMPMLPYKDKITEGYITYGIDVNWKKIEQLPAIAAGVSYGSKKKLENDSERAIKLNKKLISQGHLTPLEAIQFNFHISGISKACGAQMSRHRAGQGHVSASRRFQTAEPGFIYPTFDYLDDEYDVRKKLGILASTYSVAYETYDRLRSGKLQYDMKDAPSMRKEDARVVLPVSYATERSWFINARALRDFFRLRLAADAEWEIRRLAWTLYDLVCPLMSSLFEDIVDTSSVDETLCEPNSGEDTGWVVSKEIMKNLSGDLTYEGLNVFAAVSVSNGTEEQLINLCNELSEAGCKAHTEFGFDKLLTDEAKRIFQKRRPYDETS